MMRKQVIRFFGGLLLLAGALLVLQLFSFNDMTGASVYDEGSGGLSLNDVRAVSEDEFIHISFYVESERNQVQIVYSLDAAAESIRTGEFTVIVEPGHAQPEAFRIALPEQSIEDLFVTISVGDGVSFAYQRVVVTKSGARGENSLSRSLVSMIGFIALLCFVMVYVVRCYVHRRRVHSLARRAGHHLAFRPRTSALGVYFK